MYKSIIPRPLNKNSTIGLICPAGGFVDYKPIALVIKYLKKSGYNVKLGKSLVCSNKDYKYLSGSDAQRLKDLHSFWKDETVDAIFCLRGGYGSLRLLNNIDFHLIKKHKKILLGFSDITVLLLAIYAKTQLITFHGPLIGYKFIKNNLDYNDNQSANYMWKLLCNPELKFHYSHKNKSETIYNGKARGVLLGGNLTDICSMIGSSYLPDFKNSILFLEDVNEEPYKIDRLFTQLINSGIINRVKGLIFTSFEKCGFKNNYEIMNLIKDRFKNYKIPTIFNFPIGHGRKNYAIPIGMNVLFDADKCTLSSLD